MSRAELWRKRCIVREHLLCDWARARCRTRSGAGDDTWFLMSKPVAKWIQEASQEDSGLAVLLDVAGDVVGRRPRSVQDERSSRSGAGGRAHHEISTL
jgi:hypothetical protein